MEQEFKKSKKILVLLLANLVVFVFVFVFFEVALGLWLRNFSSDNERLLEGVRNYYMGHERKIIQFRPEFAKYDQELSYTLRPGNFIFDNIEFSTPYTVNSLGVRDDEKSLSQPEIIIVGDSHAMGWGVGQNDTFASLLEQETGLKVLNTAISSYGTVREMKILTRVDRSHMRYLIIQYCQNDFGENKIFLENDGVLPIMKASRYETIQEKHLRKSRYYFGKYTRKLLPDLLRSLVTDRNNGDRQVAKDDSEEIYEYNPAEAFLKVLVRSGIDFTGVNIIVFEMNRYGDVSGDFLMQLQNKVQLPEMAQNFGSFRVVNMSDGFKPDFLFRLDDHTNELCHRFMAEKIAPLIQ